MFRPIILLLLLLAIITQALPQLYNSGKAKASQADALTKPSFPGGPNALFDYLETKLKYPYNATLAEQEAVVRIKFLVNRDGSLSNFLVMNKADDDLQVAAVQIVQMMPHWEPARQHGEAIPQAVILPIHFRGEKLQP